MARTTESVVLPDGTAVELAPMLPTDGPRLLEFHHGLSADTVRRRFFSLHPELSSAELHRFTHVDHVDREAVIAVSEGQIVAVGRFDRIDRGPGAELAFVVADSWQGRGLGTALLSRLVARAREVGLTRLVAQTLADNRQMRAVFRQAGLPIRERLEGGVVDVTLDLGSNASVTGQVN
jgi:RimJ/RimL family protein N-acetyltransferase